MAKFKRYDSSNKKKGRKKEFIKPFKGERFEIKTKIEKYKLWESYDDTENIST